MHVRILIAEDEKDLNQILTSRLKAEHYSVDSCKNGREVLEYMAGAEYDALVLDIMMPVLDGLSVLKKIRQRGCTVPVLLLTAKTASKTAWQVLTPERTIILSNHLPLRSCLHESGYCYANLPRLHPAVFRLQI